MIDLNISQFLSDLMLSKYIADAYSDSQKLKWWVRTENLRLNKRGYVGDLFITAEANRN